MADVDRPDHCWVWGHDLFKKQRERLAKASWSAKQQNAWSNMQKSASWSVKKNHGKNARSNAWKYSL